ncbi:hypothetical protein SEA_MORRIGAN_3 [Microbacterium phage Morrigan]|nr:hypothetical protein SEA_MORRIGAN_3 [Microbacterium phage Morrigan]
MDFLLQMVALLGGGVVVAWLIILFTGFLLDLPMHVAGWTERLTDYIKTRKGH